MSDDDNETVELDVTVHARTESAVFVSRTGWRRDAKWFPRSRVKIDARNHMHNATIEMPKWLARDRGFL